MGRRKPDDYEDACASPRHVYGQGNRRDDRPRPEDSGVSDPVACINACRDQFIMARTGETGDNFEEICRVLSQAQHNEDLRELYTCDATYCGVANCAADLDRPPTDPKPDLCRDEASPSSGTEPPCPPAGPSALTEPAPDGRRTTVLGDFQPSTASRSATSATPTSSIVGGTNSSNTAPNVAASSDPLSTGLSTGGKAAIGICSGIAFLLILLLILFIIRRRRKDHKAYLRAADQPPRLSRPPSRAPSGALTPLITPPPSASSRNPPATPPERLSNRKFLPLILRQADTAQSSPSSLYPPSEYQDSPAQAASGYYNKLSPPQPQSHERRQTPMPLGNTAATDLAPDSPLPPLPPPVVLARDSAASLGNYPATTAERSASRGGNKANSVDSGTATVTGTSTPPVSPPWSPASPLAQDLPDLASAPLGPPPNRALPPTPLQSHQQQRHNLINQQRQYQVSPTSTLSLSPLSLTFPQHQQHSPQHPYAADGAPVFGANAEKPPLQQQQQQQAPGAIGLAVAPPTPSPTCTIIAAPNAGHAHNHSSSGSREDLSTHDLRELTESYARETRESWGSWSGAGGGGPGVGGGGGSGGGGSSSGGFGGTGGRFKKGSNGSPRSSGSVAGGAGAAVSMRDLDLEKLGGSYR